MKTIIILLLTASLLVFTFACDNGGNNTEQPRQQENSADILDIGEGSTVFLFEVTDSDGNLTAWNVHTNETTVGAALIDVGLIDGTVSDFGLMVTYVNGIRADFMEDGTWWAFYIDGEMAMAGVDTTEIKEGVTYAFVCTDA